MSEADDPEQAKKCAEQLASVPEEKLDSVLRQLRDDCYDALVVRGTGGAILPVLANTVRRMKNIPLDENPGEEYHRGTNLSFQKAANITTTC